MSDPGAAADAKAYPRSTRRKARKRAIDILFEAELRGADPLTTLADRTAAADPPVREFTAQLVRGVVDDSATLDATIAAHLQTGWSLGRLPRVDRIALRIGAYELAAAQVPVEVVIAEAVALVGELSTDDSPAFVNAVLAAISRNQSSRRSSQ